MVNDNLYNPGIGADYIWTFSFSFLKDPKCLNEQCWRQSRAWAWMEVFPCKTSLLLQESYRARGGGGHPGDGAASGEDPTEPPGKGEPGAGAADTPTGRGRAGAGGAEEEKGRRDAESGKKRSTGGRRRSSKGWLKRKVSCLIQRLNMWKSWHGITVIFTRLQ